MNSKTTSALPDDLIAGETGDWEVVIGLEVHAQITSNSKLFSSASTTFGSQPNNQVSLVDAGMPGMLPVINRQCVAQAIRTGLGLNARINKSSVFERKNYFYPDLPQGYQISQYKYPIVGEGLVAIKVDDKVSNIGIERLHLEQDAGKLIHDMHPDYSYVDLNRSGIALMEIVSKPELHSAKQAQAYVTKLRTIMRYLGTCDGDMERGNLRADINISVRRPGKNLGTRCEIKNVNSIRFIGQAIEIEALRQIDILEDGGEIIQETRFFNPDLGETQPLRCKEEAHDYRYFPDPDLVPLEIDENYIKKLATELPELPDVKFKRFIGEYALSSYDASILVAEKQVADYFEAVAHGFDGKLAANWIINDVFGRLNKAGLEINNSPVSANKLRRLLELINDEIISGKTAKDIFDIMWSDGGDPAEIVEQRGLKQLTDTTKLKEVLNEVIAENSAQVQKINNNPKLLGWFVGQVMKKTGGKANPKIVKEIVQKRFILG